jgi:hypothetical protein
MAKQNSTDLIAMIEDVYNIIPWIALIFGILGVFAGISLIGVSPLGLMGGVHNSALLLLSGIASLVASVMMLIAFPKLQKRLMGGWVLLFWSEVVNIASSLLTLSVGSVIATVIWAAIAFYILFQIKSHYK